MVQLRPILVVASKESADAIRSDIPIQCEKVHVAGDAIAKRLCRDEITVERFVLGSFTTSTVDDLPAVRTQARESDARVLVNCVDASVGTSDEHLRYDELLYPQHNTILASYPDSGPAVVNSFGGIVDLEDLAVGAEGGWRKIVPGAYATHDAVLCS